MTNPVFQRPAAPPKRPLIYRYQFNGDTFEFPGPFAVIEDSIDGYVVWSSFRSLRDARLCASRENQSARPGTNYITVIGKPCHR